jgi:hypothetical protein
MKKKRKLDFWTRPIGRFFFEKRKKELLITYYSKALSFRFIKNNNIQIKGKGILVSYKA